MSSSIPTRIVSSGHDSTISLDEVDILQQLEERPSRLPDRTKEFHAFNALAGEMASNPLNMLQRLVEVAVDLCDAHTAGVSLLDGDVFRWEAVAGVFASAKGGTMPRAQSPCGVCIDRQATQLMYLADRCFPALRAEPRFVEALLVPFFENGTAIGTVWIVSHTEDRKFNKEDERIVAVLSRFASAGWQLLRNAEALGESNRRKDDFLATLGHELRNPLSAIVTATAVLEPLISADRTAGRVVGIIARQSRHIACLAEDLLDVAGIARGKVRLSLKRIDLRALTAQVAESNRSRIEGRGHAFHLDLGQVPVWVHADAGRISQVISNLLDNAAKYTPDGGFIAVVLTTDGGHASLKILDNGIGVEPARRQEIFEPFKQVSDSTTASAGGLGLGLALVKSLIELHGGSVDVVSVKEGGSCFTVSLPLSAFDK